MEKIVETMYRLIIIKSQSRSKKPLEKKFTLKCETNKTFQRKIKIEQKI